MAAFTIHNTRNNVAFPMAGRDQSSAGARALKIVAPRIRSAFDTMLRSTEGVL